jgi:hypothetical protein
MLSVRRLPDQANHMPPGLTEGRPVMTIEETVMSDAVIRPMEQRYRHSKALFSFNIGSVGAEQNLLRTDLV